MRLRRPRLSWKFPRPGPYHYGAAAVGGLGATGYIAKHYGAERFWLGAFAIACLYAIIVAVLLIGGEIIAEVPYVAPPDDRTSAGPSLSVEQWRDDTGVLYWVHSYMDCAGTSCAIHLPSNHAMVTWKRVLRVDRSCLLERLCPTHGIGHPDPDSVNHFAMLGIKGDWTTHGCCGCCPGAGFTGNGPLELPAVSLGTAQDEVIFRSPDELLQAQRIIASGGVGLPSDDVYEEIAALAPQSETGRCVYCQGELTRGVGGGWYHEETGRQICQLVEGQFPTMGTPRQAP